MILECNYVSDYNQKLFLIETVQSELLVSTAGHENTRSSTLHVNNPLLYNWDHQAALFAAQCFLLFCFFATTQAGDAAVKTLQHEPPSAEILLACTHARTHTHAVTPAFMHKHSQTGSQTGRQAPVRGQESSAALFTREEEWHRLTGFCFRKRGPRGRHYNHPWYVEEATARNSKNVAKYK